jgi:hypothetical protein
MNRLLYVLAVVGSFCRAGCDDIFTDFSPASPGWYYAWYMAFRHAVGDSGEDIHGAGAVRFDTKYEGGERYYNYVRCVR